MAEVDIDKMTFSLTLALPHPHPNSEVDVDKMTFSGGTDKLKLEAIISLLINYWSEMLGARLPHMHIILSYLFQNIRDLVHSSSTIRTARSSMTKDRVALSSNIERPITPNQIK